MNETNDSKEWIEFRPRPSSGRYWTTAIGLALLALAIVPLPYTWQQFSPLISIWIFVTGLLLAFPVLVAAWYFPAMRYWLGPTELVLSYGPLMNDRVPLDSITSIQRRNLRTSLLASFRFPGLALFDVDYVGDGRVRTCSTSATRQILLLDAGRLRYGISPEDESGFVSLLREHASGTIKVPLNAEWGGGIPRADCEETNDSSGYQGIPDRH